MGKKNTKIINVLLKNARISIADLAKKACLSAPATVERLRKLEEQGVITGYAAKVDLSALGHAVSAVVRIKPFVGCEPRVIRFIQSQQCVVSAYNVTGEYAFVMEVSLESTKSLDALLESMSEFSHTDTSVILSAIDCGGFAV